MGEIAEMMLDGSLPRVGAEYARIGRQEATEHVIKRGAPSDA